MERRPLRTRSRAWAKRLSQSLRWIGLTPNTVSALSVVFAGAAGLILWWSPTQPLWFIAATAGIQVRLLCNMLDGLMAIEGGATSPTGELFNELPDRLADVAILVGAGYAVHWPVLGWAAAVLAVLTAYVRAVGGALGKGQDFCGPLAKPQRMFVMTLGCLGAAAQVGLGQEPRAVGWALVVIVIGSAFTVVRRVVRLARRMETS